MTRIGQSVLAERLQTTRQVELLKAAEGRYPDVAFRIVSDGDARVVNVNGRDCVMLAANDYLGLRWDPRVVEAAIDATKRYGTGASSSRLVAGAVELHGALEEELADWLGREAALVFTSGYQANVGAISALVGRHDVVLCDRAVHASIVDGCRLGGATVRRFDRADISTLQRKLARHAPTAAGCMVVADAVYSMDGDTLPLPQVVTKLRSYPQVLLMIDEAHSLGVLGSDGSGLSASSNGGERVDLISGNLSKALSSSGGYVAGGKDLISALKVSCRSLIFSTAGAPATIASALAALRIARAEPERRMHALAMAARLRDGLGDLGLDTGASDALIVPAILGDEWLTIEMTQALLDEGICVGYAVAPAVAAGGAMLRFSVNAAIAPSDVDHCLEVLATMLNRQSSAFSGCLSRHRRTSEVEAVRS